MNEFYSDKYDVTFTIIGGDLYELIDDEWEPIDWDIVEEDEEMAEDYRNVVNTLQEQSNGN